MSNSETREDPFRKQNIISCERSQKQRIKLGLVGEILKYVSPIGEAYHKHEQSKESILIHKHFSISPQNIRFQFDLSVILCKDSYETQNITVRD